MTKKIIVLGALSGLMLASFATQAETDKMLGWYGKVETNIGSAYKENKRYVADLSRPRNITAGLGYKFGYLRADATYGYEHYNLQLWNQNGFNKYHTHANTLAANGYFDFDNSTIFSPYLGLGLQKTLYSHHHRYGFKNPLYLTGTVGSRVYVKDNLALDVAYKTDMEHVSKGGSLALGLAYQFG